MVLDVTAVIVALTILALPWTLKIAKLWDKTKKWYNFLISGLIVGLLGVTMSAYAQISFVNLNYNIYWIVNFFVNTLAMIFLAIGIVGITKNLLFK